jgi:hypothetical protein
MYKTHIWVILTAEAFLLYQEHVIAQDKEAAEQPSDKTDDNMPTCVY